MTAGTPAAGELQRLLRNQRNAHQFFERLLRPTLRCIGGFGVGDQVSSSRLLQPVGIQYARLRLQVGLRQASFSARSIASSFCLRTVMSARTPTMRTTFPFVSRWLFPLDSTHRTDSSGQRTRYCWWYSVSPFWLRPYRLIDAAHVLRENELQPGRQGRLDRRRFQADDPVHLIGPVDGIHLRLQPVMPLLSAGAQYLVAVSQGLLAGSSAALTDGALYMRWSAAAATHVWLTVTAAEPIAESPSP